MLLQFPTKFIFKTIVQQAGYLRNFHLKLGMDYGNDLVQMRLILNFSTK